MKQLFAYIRVSTLKQGQGVSLQEQRAAIERYVERSGAQISQWFEERKTAAKAGRPEFVRMVKLLRRGAADGFIIHKIDRSTRNYRDWAEIDDLIESGIDVYFASDDLDLRSRGGRLAADIQVAVAVDYIRNLREEALKGIHGRLKQGILPNKAPIGYLDRGAGNPKVIDPVNGPLVRRLFELYATGGYALRDLTREAAQIGLQTTNKRPLQLTHVQKILRNVFYLGFIRSSRFGLFTGAHEALVPRALFDRVQEILSGKVVRRTKRHEYVFRRLIRCAACDRALVGSVAKGMVYYRCQVPLCPTTCLREDVIDRYIREALAAARLSEADANRLVKLLLGANASAAAVAQSRKTALSDSLEAVNARLTRLTDLLIDGKIESAAHDERRAALLLERQRIEQELANTEMRDIDVRSLKILELAKSAETLYENGNPVQKRRLLEIVTSNRVANGKTLEISLREPFVTISMASHESNGGPFWNTARTFSIERVIQLASEWSPPLVGLLNDTLASETVQAAPNQH